MAKTLKRKDIIELNPFENLKQSAESAQKTVNALAISLKAVKASASVVKSTIPKERPKNTKEIKDFNSLTEKSNRIAKAKLKIDKNLLIEKAKLSRLQAEQNKQIKTTIEATRKLTVEEKKNLGTLEKLEISNRKLRAERAKLNLETKKGQIALKKINSQLDINNAKIRSSGDSMKKQRLNVGNYNSAITKLSGALAKLGLAFGVFSLIRNSFNVIKDFGQAQADLASILGTNVNGMKELTEQSQKLGATTTFTASQVSELQKEFAKLGFTQLEIENVTEATLLLAEATGTDLARAAEVTGATIRGFGLNATDTQRVVDVMAKSFSSSSLDMEKFATAMSSVAPVAKNAGFSIEQTTALIGTLTDRGVDASSAGTGLRNMFLDAKKNGLTLNEALKQINEASDKTAESFDLFGKRGATLGVILAENGQSVEDLTVKLVDADASAKNMAETQRKTLGGAIKLLTSAWEGFILKMNEAGGVGDKLRKAVVFLADNLETIFKIIGQVSKALLIYKGRLLAIKILNSDLIKDTKAFGKALFNLKKGAKGAGSAFKNMGGALKAIGWTAIIAGAIALGKAFWDAATGARQLRVEAHQMEVQVSNAQESGNKFLDDLKKKETERIEDIRNRRKLNEITSKEELEQIAQAKKATEDRLEDAIKSVKKRTNENSRIRKGLEREIRVLTEKFGSSLTQVSAELSEALGIPRGFIPKSKQDILKLQDAFADFSARVEAGRAKVKLYTVALNESGRQAHFAKTDVEALGKSTNDLTDSNKKVAKSIDDEVIPSIEREKNTIEDTIKRWEDFVKAREKSSEETLKTFSDSERANLQRNVYEAEYNLLIADQNIKEAERNNLLINQILAKAELEKLGKSSVEQQLIDLRARKEISDLSKEEIKNAKEIARLKSEALDFAQNLFIKNADERIKKLNEESEAHKKQADLFRELAKNGNIDAKESLAEENRLAKQAEAEAQRLEQQKQRILMVTSLLKAFNSNLDAGDDSTTAFTKAITSQALLDQFASSIGSFFVGTEDTGVVGNPLDSNGGRLALIHNNERIMTKKQNDMIGDFSNDEVAKTMEEKRLGRVVSNYQVGSTWESALIVNGLMDVSNKLDIVNKSIKNAETSSIELGEITQATMQIIETRKRGGISTINTYKVK